MYGEYNFNSDFAKRNVAIYARVSTEHEEQISALENQVDWYRPILASRPDWTLVGQYVDEGITGTSAQKRPQFLKMIRDAKAQKFDMIITREVSRFARNTVDTLQYTRKLKEYGVEVFFINDNIKTFDGDGELRLTIMATLAQDESRKTSVRVKAGLKTAIEKGVVFGNGNILGYDRVGKEMVINPEQAKTVRMMFDMYLNGMGMTKIGYELEKAGRLTASGNTRWHAATISKTLKNSFYCGIMTYHKEYVPDYLKQKKVKNLGEIDLVHVRGMHTPIVTEDEYNRVQEIMNKKAYEVPNGSVGKRKTGMAKSATTVWPRIMRCACGAKFNQRSWNHHTGRPEIAFQCYRVINSGSVKERSNKGISIDNVCTSPIVPEWKLQMISQRIFSQYLDPSSEVIETALALLRKHIEKDMASQGSTVLAAKMDELTKLTQKRERLIEMRMDGELDKEFFLERKKELETKIDVLTMDIKRLSPLSDPEYGKTVEERLADLREKLEQYTDFKSLKVIPETMVEAFTEKIIVSHDGFDWFLRFGKDGNISAKCDGGKPKDEYSMAYSFKLTLDEAKKYVYSLSSRRRVRGWKDITINLWI